jgi:hypothetical protein
MKRFLLLVIVVLFTVLDSLLLASPNLLGKVGMFIYKIHYLRTFPRALLTVGIVVTAAVVVAELLRMVVRKGVIGRGIALVLLLAMIASCSALTYKVWIDLSKGTESHLGLRFRYGAYLLPALLIMIFINAIVSLPKARRSAVRAKSK